VSEIIKAWITELDSQIAAEENPILRKPLRRKQRVARELLGFASELKLDGSIDEALADENGSLYIWFLIAVLKQFSKTAVHNYCSDLRAAVKFWYEQDLIKFHPVYLASPTDPPEAPPCPQLDAWTGELNRRVWSAQDADGNPLPKAKIPADAMSYDGSRNTRCVYVAYLWHVLETLELTCVLGDWGPEIVWLDGEEHEQTPEEVFARAISSEEAPALESYLRRVCLTSKVATTQGISSKLRGAFEFLFEADLCRCPPSRVVTPTMEPELPKLEIMEEWFAEISRRATLSDTTSEHIAENYADLLRRVFKAFVRYSLQHLGISLKMTEDGVVGEWIKPNKSDIEPLEHLVTAILAKDGALPKRFLADEAKRTSAETVVATASALRKAFEYLHEAKHTEFTSPQLITPGKSGFNPIGPKSKQQSVKGKEVKGKEVKGKAAKAKTATRSQAPAKITATSTAPTAAKKRQSGPSDSDLLSVLKSYYQPVERGSMLVSDIVERAITLRDKAILELISHGADPLSFSEICLLRATWYDSDSGLLRYLKGAHNSGFVPASVTLTGNCKKAVNSYVSLVLSSQLSRLWEKQKRKGDAPLFFAQDGGNLTLDNSEDAKKVQKGFFAARDNLVTLLMRTHNLSYRRVVALRRAHLTDTAIVKPEKQQLDEAGVKALRGWLQAARVSNLVSWAEGEKRLPLLFSANGEELSC